MSRNLGTGRRGNFKGLFIAVVPAPVTVFFLPGSEEGEGEEEVDILLLDTGKDRRRERGVTRESIKL